MTIQVSHFKDPLDFVGQAAIAALYEGVFPIAPILHQALTGNGMLNLFVAADIDPVVIGTPTIRGAAILKSPESVCPIGEGINPLAWVISDVVVHESMRGRGIALALIRAVEDVAIRNGGRIIYLYTENDNKPALRLYEKAKFMRLKDQGDKAVFAKVVTDNPRSSIRSG